MSTDPLNRHLYVAGQSANSLVVFALPTPAISLTTSTATAQLLGPAVILDSALTVLDTDSTHLVSATVAISAGHIATDALATAAVSGISASYDAATGVLSLSGSATLVQYQTALRSLTYQAGADADVPPGGSSTRVIDISVSDGDNTSAAVSIMVTVERSADLIVTPSAGANGSIAPATPQVVPFGMTATFTVTPNAGYGAHVGGTCGGHLIGDTYTTDAIMDSCTISVSFQLLGTSSPTLVPASGWMTLMLMMAILVGAALVRLRHHS